MKVLLIALTLFSLAVLAVGIAEVSGEGDSPGWTYVVIGGFGSIAFPIRLARLGKGVPGFGLLQTTRQVKFTIAAFAMVALVSGVVGTTLIVRGEVAVGVGFLGVGVGAVILGLARVIELRGGYHR